MLTLEDERDVGPQGDMRVAANLPLPEWPISSRAKLVWLNEKPLWSPGRPYLSPDIHTQKAPSATHHAAQQWRLDVRTAEVPVSRRKRSK